MKKILTLGALSLLSASSAFAQAPTLDGRIMASEIGTGPGKYQSMGMYTNPHGYGPWGLKVAFVAEDAAFIYVAINGTVESGGNALQIYFDVPNFPGRPACVPLPAAPSPTGDPTSFTGMVAAMEMEVDAGVAYRVNGGTPQLELVDYRPATSALPESRVLGTMTSDGTAATFLMGAARAAYLAPAGDILTNVDEGLEFAVAKAAYGIVNGADLHLFVLMSNQDGAYLSTDFIPQDTNGGSGNLDMNADFCDNGRNAGTQYITYRVGTGIVQGTRKLDAAALNFSVAPNPVNGTDASVNFSLAKSEAGSVIVTDLLGRTVATLANGTLPAGAQRLTLKSANLAAGQYIVKLQLGNSVATRKVSVQ